MGFVSVKCPDCGAEINLDESREFGFCSYCGAKVVQEKIVIEHRGNVKIDDSKELKNLYQAARNAREAMDNATALLHYQTISAKDPNSWEAQFYTAVLRYSTIKNAEISVAAVNISNCLSKVFSLIKGYVKNEAEKKAAVAEVVNKCYSTTLWLLGASFDYYDTLSKTAGRAALGGVGGLAVGAGAIQKALNEEIKRCVNIGNIMCICGNCIEGTFDMKDPDYASYAVTCWKKMIEINTKFREKHKNDLFNQESLDRFIEKIQQYDDSYEEPETGKKGCYVATCVYGSYDCPQVWTLRRYRDNTLASTWYGRAFVKTYYAVSPTLVAWFGHTEWFKKLWRNKLDRMVASLQKDGVKDTPYLDKNW